MSIKFKSRVDAEQDLNVYNALVVKANESSTSGIRLVHGGTTGYIENSKGKTHFMGSSGGDGAPQVYMTFDDTNSRRVGISSQDPAFLFDVGGAIGLQGSQGLHFEGSTAGVGPNIISNTSHDLKFRTRGTSSPYSNAERMTILASNGYVGINNTSPDSTFHVGGNVRIDTISNLTSQGLKFLIADSNGEVKYRSPSQVLSDIGAGTGGGNVSNTGTPANNQLAIWTDATTIEGVSNLTYNGTTLNVDAQVDIDASGVACEITSNQSKALVLRGGVNSSNIQEWGTAAAASIYSVVDNNGNFGIRNTNPGKPLDVTGTIRTSTDLIVGETGQNGYITLAQSDSDGDTRNSQIMFQRALEFRSDGGSTDNILRLEHNGDVSIQNGSLSVGTNNTDATVTIKGTVGSVAHTIQNSNETTFRLSTAVESSASNTVVFRHGLYYNTTENASIAFFRGGSTTGGFMSFQTNNGTERMRIESGGNVGIQTTSPNATLHVDSPVTTAASLTFGDSCGQIFQNENSELAIGLSNSSPYNLWMQARKNSNAARNIALQPLGGNVGVGFDAANITEKLHVNGVVKADGGLKGYVPAFHHGGFYHSGSGSSNSVYWLPTNYIVETTSSQYYNVWTAPYDGRVIKIIMRYASGSTPQATSVTFRWAKNGTTQLSSFAGAVTSAASTSMRVVKEFANTDITFSEGDRYKLGFQTNGGNRLLYGFSYTIVIEYNKD